MSHDTNGKRAQITDTFNNCLLADNTTKLGNTSYSGYNTTSHPTEGTHTSYNYATQIASILETQINELQAKREGAVTYIEFLNNYY